MSFNRERMLFKRQPRDVTLSVNLPCTHCDTFINEDDQKCKDHDAMVENVYIKVVGIPWARLNYIKSQAVSFDDNKKTYFDGQFYINECLKLMVLEAPWGKTDDVFLLQVDKPLGRELEKIVPKASSENENDNIQQDFSEIKKE
mgnify:FL=1